MPKGVDYFVLAPDPFIIVDRCPLPSEVEQLRAVSDNIYRNGLASTPRFLQQGRAYCKCRVIGKAAKRPIWPVPEKYNVKEYSTRIEGA